ncbi:hypothetical protein Acr_02g0004660 [Actinidia rufa]|uniref:Uncharacterized protein n=1 Tax=Actinidia rufa TaxID=165716 RepID=A0A7J0E7Q4_9ERIC|nr:hypothetical protein Acr_02g0004660 [Actinidia rufa]
MPVSGKEETGNISRQSSNCSAGVPIKKRRFPLVRPPSPPPQEPCSIRAENDSIQKECSNTSQGSSLSDASVPTNSPGLSDVNRNSFAKERKEGSTDTNVDSVQSNVNLSWVKIEEPNLSMLSASVDIVDNKEKRLLTEKSAFQKISETTELHLALNKELAPNDGEGILFKQDVEKDCKVEPSTVSGNTELSLGLKEPWIPALTGQNRKQSYQLPDKVHPSAFCLSLGKGKPITSKNDENNSNDDTDCLHASRSNWDLNTTMDAWDEGSVGGVVSGQGAVGFEVSIGIGSKLSSDETIGTSGAKDLCVDDSEIRGLAVMKDLALDSRGNGEGSASDEEKFNISTDMLEEDSFSSDYESDGNRSVVTPRDEQFREDDDDYEDGEVREPPLFAGSDGAVAEKSEAENVNLVDCVIKNVDLCYPGGSIITKSGFNEKEKKLEGLGPSDNHIKECIDAVLKEKTDQGVVKDGSLLESTVEVAAVECDDKGPINTNLLDRSGDGPRPFRFRPEADPEFVERNFQTAVDMTGNDSLQADGVYWRKTHCTNESDEKQQLRLYGDGLNDQICFDRVLYFSEETGNRNREENRWTQVSLFDLIIGLIVLESNAVIRDYADIGELCRGLNS